jgi:DNA-binding response OmpR family regulator
MRVLIVEDDEMLAMTLQWIAEEQGDEAQVCHLGAQAIETAQATQPDLVVVDMELPDMEGTEVCRALRNDEATADATLVAYTAFSDNHLRRQAKIAGCHDFFVKGVDFKHLLALFQTMHARLSPT